MSTASRLRRPQSGTNSPRRLGGEHLREHEGSCRPCLQQRRASRQSRVLPPHRPGRRRDRRPRVARLHETRARDSGGCPTRRETRKFSKQVSARFVAQTRNARISGNSRPRSDRATARGPRRPAGRAKRVYNPQPRNTCATRRAGPGQPWLWESRSDCSTPVGAALLSEPSIGTCLGMYAQPPSVMRGPFFGKTVVRRRRLRDDARFLTGAGQRC